MATCGTLTGSTSGAIWNLLREMVVAHCVMRDVQACRCQYMLEEESIKVSPNAIEVSRNALYRVLCSACCSVLATSCSVNSGATPFGAARVVNHCACCLLLFIQIQFNYITYLLCRQQCRKNAHGGWMLPPDIHPASLGYISCRMIKKTYYQN